MEEKKTFHHFKRLKVNHIKEIQKKKIFPGENKKENRLSIRYKVKTLLN